jgi:hypothetical protein
VRALNALGRAYLAAFYPMWWAIVVAGVAVIVWRVLDLI